MPERLLVGPFLTRAAAGRRAGQTPGEVSLRPDLMHIGGETFHEAYFAFQFGRRGVRSDLSAVVLALKTRFDDTTIADWMVRGNSVLGGDSPLRWLNQGKSLDAVISAAESDGPSNGDRQGSKEVPPSSTTLHRSPAKANSVMSPGFSNS